MTKIRIASSSAYADDGMTNYKMYITKVINHTLIELKTALASYHPVKEIEGRNNLASFFKQKIADFELLYLLDFGTRYFPINNQPVVIDCYEEIADRLAFVYTNLKKTIAPQWDVKSSLQSLYLDCIEQRCGATGTEDCMKEGMLRDVTETRQLDTCTMNTNEVEAKQNVYLHRFLKIHLQKENLSSFKKVSFESNLIILDGIYKIALCGDVCKPVYKLINAEVPIHDFSVSIFNKYVEIKTKYCALYELKKKLKKLREKIKLKIEGNYKNFIVDIEDTIIEVSGKCWLGLDENSLEQKIYEKTRIICDKQHGLHFTISEGWYCIFKNFKIIDKVNEVYDVQCQKLDNAHKLCAVGIANDSRNIDSVSLADENPDAKYVHPTANNFDGIDHCNNRGEDVQLVAEIRDSTDVIDFVRKYRSNTYKIYFWSVACFTFFKNILDLETKVYLPLINIYKHKLIRNDSGFMLDNLTIAILTLREDTITFNLYVQDIQICIHKNVVYFENKQVCTRLCEFHKLLSIDVLREMCSYSKVDYVITLCDNYCTFVNGDICIDVHKNMCKIRDVEIYDINLYLIYIQNVYMKADVVIKELLCVEIEGFRLEYDTIKNKIVSDLYNDRIYMLDNINEVIRNLKVFYKYNMVPDIVTRKTAIFYLQEYISKFTFVSHRGLNDDSEWFGNLRQKHARINNCNENIKFSWNDFINLYNMSNRVRYKNMKKVQS